MYFLKQQPENKNCLPEKPDRIASLLLASCILTGKR